jgi:hypothetical protein
MGQYYIPMILGVKDVKEFIRLWLDAHMYGNGLKLTEHSYIGNSFVSAFEYQISEDGPFYKSRVVWAGDYADKEPESDLNLYSMAHKDEYSETSKMQTPKSRITTCYRYIVNHTKRQYVDKQGKRIHPLPILTSDGNGRGGGDYRGPNKSLAGAWARDVISIEKDFPPGYLELHCRFDEKEEE